MIENLFDSVFPWKSYSSAPARGAALAEPLSCKERGAVTVVFYVVMFGF